MTTQKVTLVRGARQLLTLRGPSGPRRGAGLKNLGIIQDGAMLIVNGRIEEIGPSRRVENLTLARRADEIDATGRVVMPGFVDCHTHIACGPLRIADPDPALTQSPAVDLNADRLALARTIHEMSPRSLQAHALHTASEAIRHGTTTLESKSGFGLTEANEVKILRVHAALIRESVPLISTFVCNRSWPEFRDAPDRQIEWICSHMLPLLKRRKLADFVEIDCSGGQFSLDHARRFFSAAAQLKLGVKISGAAQPEALELATALGLMCIDDAGGISPLDTAALARASTVAVLLPARTFAAPPHRTTARPLIDAGVAIAIATGYHADICTSQSMPMMIALACRHLRMSAAEAVSAATINGACAAGRASSVGSLEAGKTADLLILGVPDYREIPYHFGVNLVESVMKAGRTIVQRTEVKWPPL